MYANGGLWLNEEFYGPFDLGFRSYVSCEPPATWTPTVVPSPTPTSTQQLPIPTVGSLGIGLLIMSMGVLLLVYESKRNIVKGK